MLVANLMLPIIRSAIDCSTDPLIGITLSLELRRIDLVDRASTKVPFSRKL